MTFTLAIRATRAVASIRPRALCPALLLVLPVAASAVDLDYTLGASLLRSDNIQLRSFDETSDTVISPNISFEIRQDGSTVQMTATGNLAYLHYLRGTFDDEARGELTGQLNWVVVPRRMDFVLKDNLNRQPVNVLTGFNPSNQQQVNVLITGPTFYARFGEASRGQLDLRYGNSHAEETSNFNSDRYNLAARLLHDLSTTASVTANVEGTRAEFEDSTANFSRYDAYLGYVLNLTSIDINTDAGYSRLALNGTEGNESSPMARVALVWRPAPRNQFNGDLSYQFTDAAQDLLTNTARLEGPIIGDLGPGDVVIGPRVFRQRRLQLGYRYRDERLSVQIQPFYQRARYLVDLGGDETRRGATLGIDYKLRPLVTLSLVVARASRHFEDIDRRDKDTVAYLSLTDQLTRHWSWRMDLQHRGRDSSEFGASYDENAVVFSVNYRR